MTPGTSLNPYVKTPQRIKKKSEGVFDRLDGSHRKPFLVDRCCNNDPQLLYEKVSSITLHITHEWPGCKLFKKCAHAPLTRDDVNRKKWLEEGSEAHLYLVSLIKNKKMRNDCSNKYEKCGSL